MANSNYLCLESMKGSLLLKGGVTIRRGKASHEDVLIVDGRIASIAPSIAVQDGWKVIDCGGCLITSGFADLHVHFREPGFTEKETIRTGSLAAAHGGYTTVCAMPNLNPVPDTPSNIALEQDIIDRDAVVEVLPYAAITLSRKGAELVDMAAVKGLCPAFSDDGSGVQSAGMMLDAMKLAASQGCIIAAHCEDNTLGDGPESEWSQIARDLEFAALTGCRYHVCHISSAKSVSLIRDARARGVRVTCETAPHYLTLCEDDVKDDGRFRMNPPLRTAADREALIEGLADGTIDAVATDHAPHTAQEKARGFKGSVMGIVGLETAFPVLYTRLVKTGRITLERLVEALTDAPRRAFGLEGALEEGCRADITVTDLDAEYEIDSKGFLSKGRSTPFEGWRVSGRTVATFKDGNAAYIYDGWKNADSE